MLEIEKLRGDLRNDHGQTNNPKVGLLVGAVAAAAAATSLPADGAFVKLSLDGK